MDRYTELLFYGKHASFVCSGLNFAAGGLARRVPAAAAPARMMIANFFMGPLRER